MFSLICVWINDWVNNREAGDLRRYRGHYDVTVMSTTIIQGYIWWVYAWLILRMIDKIRIFYTMSKSQTTLNTGHKRPPLSQLLCNSYGATRIFFEYRMKSRTLVVEFPAPGGVSMTSLRRVQSPRQPGLTSSCQRWLQALRPSWKY